MGEKFNEPGGPIGPPDDGSRSEPQEPPQPPPEPELPQPLPEPPEDEFDPPSHRLPPSATPPPIVVKPPPGGWPFAPVDSDGPFETVQEADEVKGVGDADEPLGTGTTSDRPGTRPEHGSPPPGWSQGRDTGSQGRARHDWLQSPDGKRAIWDFVNDRWVDAATMEPMPPDWGSGYRPDE